MEGLILGVNTLYRFFCFFKLFLMGCIVKAITLNPRSVPVIPFIRTTVTRVTPKKPSTPEGGRKGE